ncbi:hypothetical protein R3W88_032158 [Solanum pinnatisectum]|uniref:Uncharacterized protein n=1 Tax=Solanum pinnatisectum TaxID=50273 RepID=A0AAV9LNE2_9SOLN|nr:hypothetical protein R3W88_032158 [Solanum pinnatisectum]
MGKERYFGSKGVLKGRTFHPEVRSLDVVKKVLDLLYFHGWVDLFLDTKLVVYEYEVVEFYVNLNVLESNIASFSGVELVFDNVRLSKNFHIPTVGLAEYERRHEASFRDIGIANALENKEPIDWPSLIIKHMAQVVDPKLGPHWLAFGNLLTKAFEKDMITKSTLFYCKLLDNNYQVPATTPRPIGPVAILLNDRHVAKNKMLPSLLKLRLFALS